MSDLRTDPIPLVLNWPEISDSVDRERQILDALSQYLADRNDVYQASSSSLLAGSIESARKANLIDIGSENEKLALRIDYGRAWVQVRQAIERAEIEIIDANRDQSVISVKFAGIKDDTDKPGFFGRLLGRGRGQDTALLQEFEVKLLDTGDTIDVVIETLGEEQSSQSRLTTELLQEINENLT